MNMQDIALYDDEIKETEGINGFTSIEIFSKGGTDEVWGHEQEECNPFSFSALDASIDYSFVDLVSDEKVDDLQVDVKYKLSTVKVKDQKGSDKNSIHIKTDKLTACEWIGMGIGWDGWQGKDLSSIMNNSAIEFMARVNGDPIHNIPIVFILEDYSANQCYATAGYLGIEGGEVTRKWTRVIIPLPTFSYQTNNIDLTNIKQLLLQCYDKVDIYIDEIKVIPYEHNYKKELTSLTVNQIDFPLNIFTEQLSSAWGISNKYCGNIKLSSNLRFSPGKFIDVNIDLNRCNWKEFGISWNNWLYTDLSSSIYGVYLEFDINVDNYTSSKVIIEDYGGKKMSVDLEKYIRKVQDDKWQKIRIPMKKFPIRESDIDLKRIKDIIFAFGDKAKLKIDNIKLTN
tara:strand:+ start:2259 stop:3452 length:1194 start_codon:yes stop_codon:yes gene_type:complete